MTIVVVWFFGFTCGALVVLFAVIIFATHYPRAQGGEPVSVGATDATRSPAVTAGHEATELLRNQLERVDLHLRRLTPIATHRPNRRKQ